MMRRLSAMALLGAELLFTLPVSAQAPEPAPATDAKAQAAQRFDRGIQLFNEGDNAGALAEFKQTYALVPNPIVLFNIGLVYAAMGRPVEAVDALLQVTDSASLSPEQRQRADSVLSDQRQRIGRIAVSTVPAGARIDVDGVEVAQTPLSAPLRVAEGTHVIGAVAEGYAHAHKEIIVAGNADASVSFELVLSAAKVPANLSVRSRLRDVELRLDGQAVGKTPLTSSIAVAPGPHTLELRRAGYRTQTQQIELGEGGTAELALDLAIDDQAVSRVGSELALELHGQSANLSIDEQRFGLYTRPLRLPPGPHHLRLESAGYVPFEQDLTLGSGQSLVLRPALVPTPETRQAHDANVRLHRTLGWIGVGSGAVIAGVGLTLVVVGGSHHSAALKDFEAADRVVSAGGSGAIDDPCNVHGNNFQPDVCSAPRDAAESRLNRANTEKLIGFIGIGSGAALLGTGLVFLLTGESAHRFDSAEARSLPHARRSWVLMPGPGEFGLALGGVL